MRDDVGARYREAPSQYTPPSYTPPSRPEIDRPRPVVVDDERKVPRVVERPTSLTRERTARTNVRRHVLRASLRIGVLLASDTAVAVLIYSLLAVLAPMSGTASVLGVDPVSAWQFAAALPFALLLTGNYGAGDGRRNPNRLLLGVALGAILPLWTSLWRQPASTIVLAYVATLVPLFIGLVASRRLLDVGVRMNRRRSRTAARTVLVGSGSLCADVFHRGDLASDRGFEVVGFVDTDPTPSPAALGDIEDLMSILHARNIDTVALCGHVSERAFSRVIKAATSAECSVLESHRTFAYAGVRPDVVWRHGRAFIELRAVTLRAPNLLMKRLFDIVVSAIALVVLSPLALALAVAVRVDSRGPIVFGHARLGRHGRYFKCYKFRTMVTNAEQVLRADPELYALYLKHDCKLPPEIDTRITRIGRFLRRTSLDELPQLWNVLRGDMSLVGPRPLVPEEMTFYGDEEPLLLSLRPGVTGLWQVVGRSSVKYPARAQIELEYVQTWSLANDLRILLMTVPAVLAQRGAH